jgi:hypothetical protein
MLIKSIQFIKSDRFYLTAGASTDRGIGSLAYWPWAVFEPTTMTFGQGNFESASQIVGPTTVRTYNVDAIAGYTACIGYVIEYKNVG